MLRAALFVCFLAVVTARNLEVDQVEPLTKDAEVEQKSEPVEAVEVSANEGRDFEFFPFRTSLRIPQLRPTGFSLFRRPISSDIFSVPSERVEDTSADTSGDAEFLPAGGSTVAAPNRRPVLFPSLGEIFGDFNRRMQVFEDEISNLFRTFVRGPDRTGVRDPVEPSEEDSSYEQRPAFPGFGLFRPFRPTFGGNGGFFGFRNPSEFPDDYKNSTSTVKVVNGTKVMVNETISKGGDENSSHFVHFKVIHMLPEDETTDATVEEITNRKEESTEVSPQATKSTTAGTEAVDLSHILPEVGSTGAAVTETTTKKSEKSGNNDINPEDFGYKVGDNEVDPHDVEVVNLPAASDKQEHALPSGIKA